MMANNIEYREFLIKEHPDINALFCIDEPSNLEMDKELFIHDEYSRTINIFSSHEEALEFLNKRVPGKKKVTITLIYN